MPQAHLPIFPSGSTEINVHLAFERRNGQVTYFHGLLPVFQHPIDDPQTFYMITSQFYVNGHATQAEICRAFGVTSISLKRAVKCYREKGPAGFYEKPARRGPAVLTEPVLEEAQHLLDEGSSIPQVGQALAIKPDTLRKAIASKKLHKPSKKTSEKPPPPLTPTTKKECNHEEAQVKPSKKKLRKSRYLL